MTETLHDSGQHSSAVPQQLTPSPASEALQPRLRPFSAAAESVMEPSEHAPHACEATATDARSEPSQGDGGQGRRTDRGQSPISLNIVGG